MSNVDINTGRGDKLSIEEISIKGIKLNGNGNVLRKECPIHKYFIVETFGDGAIHAYHITGYQTDDFVSIDNTIPSNIKEYFKCRKCASCNSSHSSMELDHKYGCKELYSNDLIKNSKDSYQNLCKSSNDAKRQHCKKCNESGFRFDARNLGFEIPFTYGSYPLDKTKENPCIGCYWADIESFRKVQSYVTIEITNNQINNFYELLLCNDVENIILTDMIEEEY